MIIQIKSVLSIKSGVCYVCKRLQSLILQTLYGGFREFARFVNFLMQETLVPQCFPVCTYYVGDHHLQTGRGGSVPYVNADLNYKILI